MAVSWVSYAVMLAFLVLAVSISKIPPKNIVRGMKPLVIILIFTGIFVVFYSLIWLVIYLTNKLRAEKLNKLLEN